MGRHSRNRVRLLLLVTLVMVASSLVPAIDHSVAHADAPPVLTGTFYGNDNSVYYVQQVGSEVWWAGESVDADANPQGGFLGPAHVWSHGLVSTSVFQGTVSGSTLSGAWVEVSRGTALGSGLLTMSIGVATDGDITHPKLDVVSGTVPSHAAPAPALTEMIAGIPIDDSVYQYPDGVFQQIPFYQRYHMVKKGINAGVVDDTNGDALGSTHNPAELRPYRDQTVFYGSLVTHDHNGDESEHLNFPTPLLTKDGLSYYNFACVANDGDLDMRMHVDTTKVPTDFPKNGLDAHDPGIGWGSDNATDEGEHGYDHQDILPKLPNLGASTTPVTFFNQNFGSVNDAIKTAQHIHDDTTSFIGTEGIEYGGNAVTSNGQCLTSTPALMLPGWAAPGGNSVLVNSRPVDGVDNPTNIGRQLNPCKPTSQTALASLNGLPIAAADEDSFNTHPLSSPDSCVAPGYGTQVRVTGGLVLDCGHNDLTDFDTNYSPEGTDDPVIRHNCDQGQGADFSCNLTGQPICSYDVSEETQNEEIHPFYSYDIIECPLGNYSSDACPGKTVRPNLTGAWGSEDGGTYYVRQMGNTIWFLGLTRNRDPMMSAPAVQIPNPTFAFKGTVTPNADGSSTISGSSVTLPKGRETGGESAQLTFTVNANNKHFDLSSLAGNDLGFPIPSHFDKLYEPHEDIAPPLGGLLIGSPSYEATVSSPLFVTSATPFTITAADGGSFVQTLWYRYYKKGATTLPQFTPVVLDSPEQNAQATFTMSGTDGDYVVETYATDASGNDESPNTTSVTLDNTAPITTITQPAATDYTHADTITLNYSVSDGTGSGVATCAASVGTITSSCTTGSLANGQTLDLLNSGLGVGSQAFTVTATDNVSNSHATSVVFNIIVTAQSIKTDVTRFFAAGKIKNAGLENSLLSTLHAAAAARARGQCATAAAIYQSFINQLTAQSGKGIDPTAATVMIGDANYLMTHCP